MSIIYVETLNIEWDRIDPKGHRRVNKNKKISYSESSTKQIKVYLRFLKPLVVSTPAAWTPPARRSDGLGVAPPPCAALRTVFELALSFSVIYSTQAP